MIFKRRWKIPVGLVAAALLAAAGITYGLYQGGYLVVKPEPEVRKSPLPPGGIPENAKQLNYLVTQAASLSAKACDEARAKKTPEAWGKCVDEAYAPAFRINHISNKDLVPALTRLAGQTHFKLPPEIESGGEEPREKYRALMCSVKFASISALVSLKDPSAVKTMLKLMDQSYNNSYQGCYFGQQDSTCEAANWGLLELKPKGVAPALVKTIKRHRYRTEQEIQAALKIRRSKGRITHADVYQEYQDSNLASCNLDALTRLGEEGKRAIADQLEKGMLTNAEKMLFLGGLAGFPLAKPEVELVKEYLGSSDAGVRTAAADALVPIAAPEYKDLFVKLYDDGFQKQACAGFGKIMAPELAPMLVKVINTSEDPDTLTAAAGSLGNFPAAQIRPALPALIEIVKTKPYGAAKPFYEAIAYADESATVKDLLELLYDPVKAGGHAIDAVGTINGPASAAALRKIIADRNYPLTVLKKEPKDRWEKETFDRLTRIRFKALFWLILREGKSGAAWAEKYFSKRTIEAEMALVEKAQKKAEQEMKKRQPAGQKPGPDAK